MQRATRNYRRKYYATIVFINVRERPSWAFQTSTFSDVQWTNSVHRSIFNCEAGIAPLLVMLSKKSPDWKSHRWLNVFSNARSAASLEICAIRSQHHLEDKWSIIWTFYRGWIHLNKVHLSKYCSDLVNSSSKVIFLNISKKTGPFIKVLH